MGNFLSEDIPHIGVFVSKATVVNMSQDHKQLRVCLIVDSDSISKWEYDAINYAASHLDIKIDSVLFCTNPISHRKYFKHFLYFALNLLSMRNKWTTPTSWGNLISDKTRIKRFRAENRGLWQSVPEDISIWLNSNPPDVILKFGMNLLSDPHHLPSKFGVLSFHHGDPTKFRGRPAGFYEIMSGEREIGVIVQRLTNSLDGGEIISAGAFKIYNHSYKRSLENAYGGGRYLLLKALSNLDSSQASKSLGKIYTLPSNSQVLVFFWNILVTKAKWVVEVLFFRKKWSISTTEKSVRDVMQDSDLLSDSKTLHTPATMAFAADPFFLNDGSIICEVVEKGSKVGNLAVIQNGVYEIVDSPVLDKTKHISFPFVANIEQSQFLLPEMASYGQQNLFEIDENNRIHGPIPLLGLENEALIDPVITRRDGVYWLFAGRLGSDLDCLFLWSAKSLNEPFIEHNLNPVVCSPRFARNAGAIFEHKGHLYRPAQNCAGSYGDGISIMRIDAISQSTYVEVLEKTIKFDDSYGPHTINFAEQVAVFDHYKKVFDPFAWKTKISF
jgi:hypothetical protein